MQPLDQNNLQVTVAMRHRTMLILWSAMLMSILLYYGLTLFAAAPERDAGQNRMLTFILTAVGICSVLVSQVVKRKFLNQSVAEQRLDLVQKGYVIGFALTEVAALLGLLDHFVTGNRYYYILMMTAVFGMALHWPRRDHLLAACYQGQS